MIEFFKKHLEIDEVRSTFLLTIYMIIISIFAHIHKEMLYMAPFFIAFLIYIYLKCYVSYLVKIYEYLSADSRNKIYNSKMHGKDLYDDVYDRDNPYDIMNFKSEALARGNKGYKVDFIDRWVFNKLSEKNSDYVKIYKIDKIICKVVITLLYVISFGYKKLNYDEVIKKMSKNSDDSFFVVGSKSFVSSAFFVITYVVMIVIISNFIGSSATYYINHGESTLIKAGVPFIFFVVYLSLLIGWITKSLNLFSGIYLNRFIYRSSLSNGKFRMYKNEVKLLQTKIKLIKLRAFFTLNKNKRKSLYDKIERLRFIIEQCDENDFANSVDLEFNSEDYYDFRNFGYLGRSLL